MEFNSSKAKELSLKNKLSLEKALEQIEEGAKTGSQAQMLFNPSEETITGLMKLGFKVTIHKDPYNGIENHICFW